MKNIAFSGKMCSGKTTLATYLVGAYKYKKVSFANGVYKVAREVFGMKEKDRELLQKVGMKLREIDYNVWVNYLLREVRLWAELPQYDNFTLDDCRFENEANKLSESGWIVIRLECPGKERLDRINHLYPNTSEEALNHISETALDNYENFDFWLDAGKPLNEVISNLDIIVGGKGNEEVCNMQ